MRLLFSVCFLSLIINLPIFGQNTNIENSDVDYIQQKFSILLDQIESGNASNANDGLNMAWKIWEENGPFDECNHKLKHQLPRLIRVTLEWSNDNKLQEKGWYEFNKYGLNKLEDKGCLRIDSLPFLLDIIVTKRVPKYYKYLAWSEFLVLWDKIRESLQLRQGQSQEVYYNEIDNFAVEIIISAPEPYKSWAWQIHSKNSYMYLPGKIIRFAPEPYKSMEWDRLMAEGTSDYFLYSIIDMFIEPYSGMAWQLLARKSSEDMTEKDLVLLKRVVNGNCHVIYKKAAVAKILTIKWLSGEDRKQAQALMSIFYSINLNSKDGYSTNYIGFNTNEVDNETYNTDEIRSSIPSTHP